MSLFNIAAGIGQSAPQVMQNVGILSNIKTEQEKMDLARQAAIDAKAESTAKLGLLGRQVGVQEGTLGIEKGKDLREARLFAQTEAMNAIKLSGEKQELERLQELRKPQYTWNDAEKLYPKGMISGDQTREFVRDALHSVATKAEVDTGMFSKESLIASKKSITADQKYLALLSISDLNKKEETLIKKIEGFKEKGDPRAQREAEAELVEAKKQRTQLAIKYSEVAEQEKVEQEKKKSEAAIKQAEADAIGNMPKLAHAAAVGGPDSDAARAYKTEAAREEKIATIKASEEENKVKANALKVFAEQMDKKMTSAAGENFNDLMLNFYKDRDPNKEKISDKAIAALLKTDPRYAIVNNTFKMMPGDIAKYIASPSIAPLLLNSEQKKAFNEEIELVKTYALGKSAVPGKPGAQAPPAAAAPLPSTPPSPPKDNTLTASSADAFVKKAGSNIQMIKDKVSALGPVDRKILAKALAKANDKEKYPLLYRKDYTNAPQWRTGTSALGAEQGIPSWKQNLRKQFPGKTDEQISLDFFKQFTQ